MRGQKAYEHDNGKFFWQQQFPPGEDIVITTLFQTIIKLGSIHMHRDIKHNEYTLIPQYSDKL